MAGLAEKIQNLQTDFCEDFEVKGQKVEIVKAMQKKIMLLQEEMKETFEALENIRLNKEEKLQALDDLVDGFCDVQFLARNAIYEIYRAMGYDKQKAHHNTLCSMMLVARANNSKRQPDGTVAYNDDGKVIKPKGWKAPEHKTLLLYGV